MNDVPPYIQSASYRKMTIAEAIELLETMQGTFEFATMTLSNKPYKQWAKEKKQQMEVDNNV